MQTHLLVVGLIAYAWSTFGRRSSPAHQDKASSSCFSADHNASNHFTSNASWQGKKPCHSGESSKWGNKIHRSLPVLARFSQILKVRAGTWISTPTSLPEVVCAATCSQAPGLQPRSSTLPPALSSVTTCAQLIQNCHKHFRSSSPQLSISLIFSLLPGFDDGPLDMTLYFCCISRSL